MSQNKQSQKKFKRSNLYKQIAYKQQDNRGVNLESESLYELWETLVNYIPGKDKIEAGEMFIKQCDDLGMSPEDIEILIDGDKVLEVALDRFFDEEEEDDEYDDWD